MYIFLNLTISIILAIIFLYNLNHYYAILQQNYYYNFVSLAWFYDYRNPNYKSVKKLYVVTIISVLILAIILLIFSLDIICYIAIVFSLFLLYLYINILSRNIILKKPLVCTKRVKRLLITNCLLLITAIFIVLELSINYSMWYIFGIFLICIINPIIVEIANIINFPIEKLIQKYYIHLAIQKLKRFKNLKVIAITGSYGKTSTKKYLCEMLKTKYSVLCTPNSFNTPMGITRTILEHLKPYHQILILEMGADKNNDILKLCKIVKPDISIITAVGNQHLKTFKTMENIINTKYQLVENTRSSGFFVTNLQNDICKKYYLNSPISAFGVGEENCYCKIVNIEQKEDMLQFKVLLGENEEVFTTKLLGKYNISNILLGVVVALKLNVDINNIKKVVGSLSPPEHRLQLKSLANGAYIIDDSFNSNPLGAKEAIQVLNGFDKKKFVITCGMVELGDEQYKENYNYGVELVGIDEVVIVNNQNYDAIADGIISCGGVKPILFNSFGEAYKYIYSKLDNHSVLLIENDLSDCYINF